MCFFKCWHLTEVLFLSNYFNWFYIATFYNHKVMNKMSSTSSFPIGWADDVILFVWPLLITDLVYASCFLVSYTYFALSSSSYTQVAGRPSISLGYERDRPMTSCIAMHCKYMTSSRKSSQINTKRIICILISAFWNEKTFQDDQDSNSRPWAWD